MIRFIAFLLLLAVPASAQTIDDADIAFLDSLLTAHYPADAPGAVALIGVDGRAVYRRAVGLASLELGVPNHAGSVLAIGSVSKQFTAVAVGQLAAQGKLSFQDDVRRHLPDYDTHGRTITIAQLLNHTSGIPSYTEQPAFVDLFDKPFSLDSLVAVFEAPDLLFEPGTDWSYSNSGYVLAAEIVEAVDGRPFNDYVREEIFAPAGMIDSDFGARDRIIPHFVTAYVGPGDGRYVPPPSFDWGWLYAAGQIVSTVDDMLKWDHALTTGALLTPDLLAEATRGGALADDRPTNYGYGWFSRTSESGLTFEGHGGSAYFLTSTLRVPERGLYVIVTSNNGTVSPDGIARQMALRALDLPTAPDAEVAVSADDLRDYEGVYPVHRAGTRLASQRSEEPMTRVLRVQRDTLFQTVTGGAPSPLVATGPDLFRPVDGYTRYRFRRDDAGAVVGLDIYDDVIQYGPVEVEPRSDAPLPAVREAIEVPRATLARYAGAYALGSILRAEVAVADAGLVVTFNGDALAMAPSSETHFFSEAEGASVRFERDERQRWVLVLEGPREYVLEPAD